VSSQVKVMSSETKDIVMAEEDERLFAFFIGINNVMEEQRNYLLGRVLTVIDALSAVPEQKKALKDLIHSGFADYRERQNYLSGEIYSQLAFKINGVPIDRIEDAYSVKLPSLSKGVADSK
jgi:hypothetical protein